MRCSRQISMEKYATIPLPSSGMRDRVRVRGFLRTAVSGTCASTLKKYRRSLLRATTALERFADRWAGIERLDWRAHAAGPARISVLGETGHVHGFGFTGEVVEGEA